MYSKFRRSRSLLNNQSHRISKLLNHSTNGSTLTPSANVSNKDCIRLAFIYGMCGTFASYLDMNYTNKILTFKFSIPSPQRFVFCTWCWAVAGMGSWMLFWTKSDTLIRAARAQIRYGLFHGIQTTTISLGIASSTIGFWSLYFDVNDYKQSNKEWQSSQKQNHELMTHSLSSSTLSNTTLIKEEDDEHEEHAINIDENETMSINGVDLINSVIEEEENKDNNNGLDKIDPNNKKKQIITKPTVKYESIMSNMYEPVKLFFLCNAPIWIMCGSLTGLIAARVLTSSILLNPINITTASIVSFISVRNNDNGVDDLLSGNEPEEE